VKALRRCFQYGPIHLALRRNDAPTAPGDKGDLFFRPQCMRNRREHVDRLLIRKRKRQSKLA